MRIRKRFLLSSLSSTPPLPDPQLRRSIPPLLVQQQPQAGHTRPQPSDSSSNQPVSPPPPDQNFMGVRSTGRPKDLEGEEAEEQKSCTKEGNILGSGLQQETDSSHLDEVGRWCGGGDDKVVPPKKRRGSFRTRGGGEFLGYQTEEKEKKKMKSKTKKCVQLQPINGEDDDNDDKETNINSTITDSTANIGGKRKKNRRRGNMTEGSRCSRVNGRGWRCGQQTLVGYSLCEHHLGKGGRLRSINNATVRNPAAAIKQHQSAQFSTLLFPGKLGQRIEDEEDEDEDDDSDDDEEEEEEEKPSLGIKKKRMKNIGMVKKARSLSSLLGQAN